MAHNRETVAIIGLGYVGLPLALLADKRGYKVIGVDNNSEKVELLNQHIAPFANAEIARSIKQSTIEATCDFNAIKKASTIIICVPTPIHEDNTPNLEPLKDACKNVAVALQRGRLVIVESTVNPGISETIVLPMLQELSGLKAGHDFYLAHCPERINPGDKQWNVQNINRVVGSLEEVGLKKAIKFYRSIITGEIKPMGSLKEAEAVKVVENAFRDINIAFVNELAQSFSKLGIDVVNVIEGAATKPFAFMPHYPGCGVGGHCIPVDPYYLIEYARENGFNHKFLSLARRINLGMPRFAVDLLVKGLNEKKIAVKDARVVVLGLSYKPEVDDYRESPSFEIIKYLEEYGAHIAIYDPFVPEKSTASSLGEALERADAAIIATAHSCFKEISPDQFLEAGVAVVIDGRNCLPKEKFIKVGIIYKGIGR